ncbi:hypothetical protein QX213_03945 [Vibrio vulnificus]|uniref:hypothetical protein n=1 Tax=Vibrio vulnificus TaxID=672 RepID=UPI001A323421|nr:hypothetical protein [Vibrio vulnificus]EHU0328791.1 hypothetical protein [Vibrio vulnificus]MDS1843047.1 hypothetical protein [Vibrio vulnificus]HAT8549226.1 hypothetical protein [Vibrio vulnificus]
MSSMEKAQVLHSLKQNFDVSEEMFQQLLSQIEDDKYKDNFERITKGLTVEDNYKMVFGSLPWVKNINGLDQNQEKRHKVDFQAPDYSLLVENSQKTNFPLLVDVKSVKGDKITCKLIPKQIGTLKNYSRDYNSQLLIAIYWEKIGYWTHNCLSSFEGKKKNSISLESAIKNDLSHVLSDYTFVISAPIYRKTYFSDNAESVGANHQDYGIIDKILLGRNLDSLKEYTVIESSIVDSMFNMSEVEYSEDEQGRYQIEVLESYPMFVKTSQWLINFLNTWKLDYSERISDIPVTEFARIHIVELMKELGFSISYLIPDRKTKGTEKIFLLAYDGTTVMNDYRYS